MFPVAQKVCPGPVDEEVELIDEEVELVADAGLDMGGGLVVFEKLEKGTELEMGEETVLFEKLVNGKDVDVTEGLATADELVVGEEVEPGKESIVGEELGTSEELDSGEDVEAGEEPVLDGELSVGDALNVEVPEGFEIGGGVTVMEELDTVDRLDTGELVVDDDDENRDGEGDVDKEGGADKDDSEALRADDDDERLDGGLSVAIEPNVVIETDGGVLGDAKLPGGTLDGSMVIKPTVGLLEDPTRLELVADNLELPMSLLDELGATIWPVDGGNVKAVKDDDDERRNEGGCRGGVGPVENRFVDMPVDILDGDAESQGSNDADTVSEAPSERLADASVPVPTDDVVVLLEQTELKTGSKMGRAVDEAQGTQDSLTKRHERKRTQMPP
ncbi:hypothetical protein CCHR01_08371 [Colletotrichum chrysophilum]|uniref:Uncharacterized protein n=1 Tax=Colletotrichum chrysophilum TaxID=1836956 RepID=A0AAD9EHY1_9PEZI|nr:hypothetical protein CCHR01_08371 [Colletotrichum chrysophilum]